VSAPEVTVVVVVKDRRERMLRCLDALLAQDHPSYEVLVVDNGSSDGTPEAVLARAAEQPGRGEDGREPVGVRIERATGSLGHARNAGAAAARGRLVAFTDSDCEAEPAWLRRLTAAFADPEVGVATGSTLPAEPPPYGDWYATIEITEQTWRFETCNAAYRRQALVEGPGFHEGVTMWEDTAAGWGALRAGWRPVFVAGAVVRHDVTYPGYRWHLRRVFRYGEGAAVLRDHPQMRERVLFARVFHRPRDVRVVAAAAGLALSRLDRRALLLAAPYAYHRRPRTLHPWAAVGLAQMVGIDLAILAGMVRGSLRWRRLIL